ncbi:MAG: hypothetical protein R3C14_48805 [Caldilineaceae bacterium]
MTRPISREDILNYFRYEEAYGGIPEKNFMAAWEIFTEVLDALEGAATDQALSNLALHLNDNQRAWLQRLAQAANRMDDAGIAALIDEEAYHAQKEPRFGEQNPDLIDMTFWKLMVQRRWSAWSARMHFDRACQAYMAELNKEPDDAVENLSEEELIASMENRPRYEYGGAVWSFWRFGSSCTRLPDGRAIWIGGEHEDFYDPDFHIYNDVIVMQPDLSIDIYGYPLDVFRPTDFHTATLVGDQIYIIGCLGHYGTRQPGVTPVYRLDCQSFRIEPVVTHGDNPGWIYEHQAEYSAEQHAIKITGGTVFLRWEGKRQSKQNRKSYWLDLVTGEWSVGQRK